MTSISVSHDKHTSTHWELQDDGTIYESTDGDGETVTAQEAFKHIVNVIVDGEKRIGFPVITAENDNPPMPVVGDPCGREGCLERTEVSDQTMPGDPKWDGFCSAECAEASDGLA
jgi:hypothetical protein